MATRALVKQGTSVGAGKETLAKVLLLERALRDGGFGNSVQNTRVPGDFDVAPVSAVGTRVGATTSKPDRPFSLHIGANLRIHGVENLTRAASVVKPEPAARGEVSDPCAGLFLHSLAEYLGERMMPALEAVKEEQKKQIREAKLAGQGVPVTIPYVPPVLPVTRWASNDAQFRSTLVVADGARQKARLSWYHPDDTMVPRDWFSRGLLEDLKYFNPFGLGDVVTRGSKTIDGNR